MMVRALETKDNPEYPPEYRSYAYRRRFGVSWQEYANTPNSVVETDLAIESNIDQFSKYANG